MSIEDEIVDKVSRGMLFPVLPRVPGTSVKRPMFVTEALQRVFDSDESDTAWELRVANLKADLDVFVEGIPIHPKYLFALAPVRDSVWEIRSVQHQPSIRVLGLFAAKDVFIATNFALRSDLEEWDQSWKIAKRTALANWRRLFGSYRPVAGVDLTNICSGALSGKYFK